MRDSNLHFNYIAQVIRCYLALVIECALRQPSATVKQPLESHSLSVRECVCVCVSVCASPVYVCLRVFVYRRVCEKETEEAGETERPADRRRDRLREAALFISITHVFASRVQYLTSVCHCRDSYHFISFSLQ